MEYCLACDAAKGSGKCAGCQTFSEKRRARRQRLDNAAEEILELLQNFSQPSECHNAEWSGITGDALICCGKCPPCRGIALLAKIEKEV